MCAQWNNEEYSCTRLISSYIHYVKEVGLSHQGRNKLVQASVYGRLRGHNLYAHYLTVSKYEYGLS